MKSTSLQKRRIAGLVAALFAGICMSASFAPVAFAQRALTVAVTPPLFQLTIGRGEFWASSIKVVNSNPYDVTYYTSLADFGARGEEGQSQFTPLLGDHTDPTKQTFSLASWITIGHEPLVVPSNTSATIPFSVRVPENAEPGGHYAAILVGTEPPPDLEQGAQVKVSSFVSSLLFVKVKGDTTEEGRIREFRTSGQLYDSPHADFVLRFENTGNTHLKPQGDIVIYNMWGKPRGQVQVNQDNNFGNVLPKSVRKFEFKWDGEANPFEIGRYSAVATLTFGEDNKQNVSATNYFWVIPVVPVSIALGSIVAFILLIMFFVRRYIRRALMLEKGIVRDRSAVSGAAAPIPAPRVMETLIEPLREGIIDLRKVAAKKDDARTAPRPRPIPLTAARVERMPVEPEYEETMSLGEFIIEYKVFVAFVALVIAASFVVWLYFHKVLTPKRTYQISAVAAHEEKASESEPITKPGN